MTIMRVTVSDRFGKECTYILPDQFDGKSTLESIERYIASTHADTMIHIDKNLGFIDWSKGMFLIDN